VIGTQSPRTVPFSCKKNNARRVAGIARLDDQSVGQRSKVDFIEESDIGVALGNDPKRQDTAPLANSIHFDVSRRTGLKTSSNTLSTLVFFGWDVGAASCYRFVVSVG